MIGIGCSGGPPFQSSSPWPKFRADAAQTGRVATMPKSGGAFWSYQTGKGIFSSPVIGSDGTIYIGSADRSFYALDRQGTLEWKVLTGEIIDSAALLDDRGRVYFGSGDGNLRALDALTGAPVWKTAADDPSVNAAYINWFEGNVALSPAGELYAPNDDYFVYAFDRSSGAITRRIKMPDQIWSLPAFDGGGRFWVGNNNVVELLGSNFFAFDAKAADKWDGFIGLGSVAASPLYDGGMVFVGSFDGYLRAFDAGSGKVVWQFGARDHIYASPALAQGGVIVQAAADGTLYGLDEKTGAQKWAYDTSDPIRSSPAIDGAGNIYFGGGDGRLHVVGSDGKARWSVQLIDADRNDVNSSPALGEDAIYVAGESGEIFSVPYDWCLGAGKSNARCKEPATTTVATGAELDWTTPFGSLAEPPATLDPNAPIVLSLAVRKDGLQQLALLDASSVTATFDPPVPGDVRVDVAGNGKFVIITPSQPLSGSLAQTLNINVSGNYLVDPQRTGLALSGGTVGGSVAFTWNAPLTPANAAPFPIPPGTVWQVSRLALPLPTLLPSYNQIGFDSLQYLVSIVETGNGHTIAWMAGAKLAADGETTIIDPATQALFPLDVTYEGGFITLLNADGVRVKVTNVTIPLQTFRIAAQLGDAAGNGSATAAARVTGTTICGAIPTYGAFLQKLGLCNPTSDVLAIAGAANFTSFQPPAAPSPSDVGTVSFAATADAVTATIAGSQLALADHVAAILLVDATTGAAVSLDYGLVTTRTADGAGKLATVTLPIGGKTIPPSVTAYLMIDVAPVASAPLVIP